MKLPRLVILLALALAGAAVSSASASAAPGFFGHHRAPERPHQQESFVVGHAYVNDNTATANTVAGFDRHADGSLTPIPGSPDWDGIYAKGEKYVVSRNWQFYDGHHVVHQPRRMSPYELQIGAIGAMEKFYSWRGIAKKLWKGDKYYAAIRYFGKKMLRDWWKDPENRAHVDWLKAQLFTERDQIGRVSLKTVGLPELLLQDSVGRLLNRFLGELGVTVVPLAEAAMEGATSIARQTVDCVITPIVKRAEKEREEFYARLTAVSAALQSQMGKHPKINFPLIGGQGPVFEPFARIGLLFTKNLDRIREAYKNAGVAEGLWEAA